MSASEKYYEENLYPFQDGILNIVRRLGLPFYLTGGTALSRHYFQHRYSDDLDLFVNEDESYPQYVEALFGALEQAQKEHHIIIDVQRLLRTPHFMQVYLSKLGSHSPAELKIDLVQDVAPHFGELVESDVLGRVDSLRNILSNKLSALFRYEPKDIVDIRTIARNFPCDWRTIVQDAKSKEASLEPLSLYEILTSFPEELLQSIKWIRPVDSKQFKEDLKVIAENILKGERNALCNAQPQS